MERSRSIIHMPQEYTQVKFVFGSSQKTFYRVMPLGQFIVFAQSLGHFELNHWNITI